MQDQPLPCGDARATPAEGRSERSQGVQDDGDIDHLLHGIEPAESKEKFCEIHATHDWTLHADRLKVEPADFPSQA